MIPQKIKTRLAPQPKEPPHFSRSLRKKTGQELKVSDPRAVRALIALMDMQAQMGGAASHFGGPSAFAEIMAVCHALMFEEANEKNKPWYELFHFVNDAGHCENGLYALKANYKMAGLTIDSLKKFRSIESVLTGHGESHLFPEGVLLSNGPLGSALPQAQGLCIADQLAGLDRLTVCAISDGGCMEGEAREALAAIPGLAKKNKMNPFVLMISDNNTKLSGRIDQDAFSMQGSFSALESFGWTVKTVENGNSLDSCLEALEWAFEWARQNKQKPVALHFKTIKGIGTQKTENSASGGHGFPLSEPSGLMDFLNEIYQSQPLPLELKNWADELLKIYESKKAAAAASVTNTSEPRSKPVATEKVQVGIGRALVQLKKKGHPIVSVTSDLPGSTGVAAFHKEFPESSIDVGVAESNMISVAAGLSKMGFIPIVDTFAQFGVTKGALPLTMAALSQAPVIAVFSHIGFQDAADGASHQGLTYLSMTCSLPYTDVFVLTSSEEAEQLMTQAIEIFHSEREAGRTPRSKIFFLGRENFPRSYRAAGEGYRLGEAQVLFNNATEHSEAVTFVAMGALVHQALEAAYQLAEKKIGSVVINLSCMNRPDLTTLRTALRLTKNRLITVEDHQVIGGMGALVSHALLQDGLAFKIRSLGVQGGFGQSAYTALELYKKHGLDSSALVKVAREMIS